MFAGFRAVQSDEVVRRREKPAVEIELRAFKFSPKLDRSRQISVTLWLQIALHLPAKDLINLLSATSLFHRSDRARFLNAYFAQDYAVPSVLETLWNPQSKNLSQAQEIVAIAKALNSEFKTLNREAPVEIYPEASQAITLRLQVKFIMEFQLVLQQRVGELPKKTMSFYAAGHHAHLSNTGEDKCQSLFSALSDKLKLRAPFFAEKELVLARYSELHAENRRVPKKKNSDKDELDATGNVQTARALR
jgi:hypothetical protein